MEPVFHTPLRLPPHVHQGMGLEMPWKRVRKSTVTKDGLRQLSQGPSGLWPLKTAFPSFPPVSGEDTQPSPPSSKALPLSLACRCPELGGSSSCTAAGDSLCWVQSLQSWASIRPRAHTRCPSSFFVVNCGLSGMAHL